MNAGLRGSAVATRLLRASSWGLADQAVLSGCSFAAAVVVARSVSADEFGAFVLAHTSLLIVTSLQAALVTQPHNVLGATRVGEDYLRYTSTLGTVQLALIVTTSLVAAATATALWAVGSPHANLAAAVAGANAAWQLLEFARRVLYTEGRIRSAFAADALGWIGWLVALALLAALERLSAPAAVLALIPSAVLGALLAGALARTSFRHSFDRHALRETWQFGKWLAAARVTFWLTSYLYVFLAAAIVGPAAAGALRAAQILLGPLNVFLLYLDLVLPIRFTRTLATAGDAGLRRDLRTTYALTAAPVLLYAAIVSGLAQPLLDLVYAKRFADAAPLVVLFALVYVLLYIAQVLVAATNARRRTRALFAANAAAAASGLAVGWLLITVFEAEGAVLAILFSTFVLVTLLTLLHSRHPSAPEKEDGRRDAPVPGFGP